LEVILLSNQPRCDFCHRFLGKNRIETFDPEIEKQADPESRKVFCSQNCNDNYYSDGKCHWTVGENPTRQKPTEPNEIDVVCPKCHIEFSVDEMVLYESEKSLTPIYCSPLCAKGESGCFVRRMSIITKGRKPREILI
jgi:hypothetical protein